MTTLATAIPTRSFLGAHRGAIAAAALALVAAGAAGGAWVATRQAAAPVAAAQPDLATHAANTASNTGSSAATNAVANPAGRTVAAAPTADSPARGTPAPVHGARRSAPAAGGGGETVPLDTQPATAAAVCASCGTVEAVNAQTVKGEGTGLGAVAGGVVGGLVGSQLGKGSGRSAMTVLGAVGGGFAGHEIEKRQRARTVYQVKVRMDDGTLRSFTRSEPLGAGQRVTVEGQTLRTADAAPPAAAPARTLQTRGGLAS